MSEYLRPWKLVTLAIGIALLVAGAYHFEAPDWDVTISFIMAALAYLTAPWSMRVTLERRWTQWPAMLFATWFTVDGSYWLYWRSVDPAALEFMRDANWPASLSLYWMCGIVWLHRGTLEELLAEARQAVRRTQVALLGWRAVARGWHGRATGTGKRAPPSSSSEQRRGRAE